jgi:predicted DNA binding CopG/RHH family protein
MTKKNSLTTPGRERVLTVRVSFDQFDQLKRTAKDNGTTLSTLIREALPIDGK